MKKGILIDSLTFIKRRTHRLYINWDAIMVITLEPSSQSLWEWLSTVPGGTRYARLVGKPPAPEKRKRQDPAVEFPMKLAGQGDIKNLIKRRGHRAYFHATMLTNMVIYATFGNLSAPQIPKLDYYISRLGRALWLVNLAGRTFPHGPLKFKVLCVAKLLGDLSPFFFTYLVTKGLKLSLTLIKLCAKAW